MDRGENRADRSSGVQRIRDAGGTAEWRVNQAGKAALFLIAGASVVMVLVTAGWQPLLRVDRRVAVELHVLALEYDGWTRVNRILTDWVWDPWTVRIMLVIAVVLLWVDRQRLLAVWVTVTCAVEWGFRTVLRWALGRERPVWEHPVDSASLNALPSGHAMTAAVGSVLLLWLARRAGLRAGLWRLAVAVAVLSVIGVCFTRMFLGVHWPTDTLSGALLGAGMASASIAAWMVVGSGTVSAQGGERGGPRAVGT